MKFSRGRLLLALLLVFAGLSLPAAAPAPGGAVAGGIGVLASFPGLDRDTIAAPAARSFPPDLTLAVGPAQLVQATNKGLGLFARDGRRLATGRLADFFNAPAAGGLLYDPKVTFDPDPARPRFYATAVQTDRTARTSSLFLAVSRTATPGSLARRHWCVYRFDGVYQGAEGGPSWADYPNLGAGIDSVLLASNQYRFEDNTFAYALLRVIDKKTLAPAAGGCGAVRSWLFQPARDFADRTVLSLQPVRPLTPPSAFPGAGSPAYLIATLDPPAATYRVWRVTHVASGKPVLTRVDVAGPVYDRPPAAPQLGSRLLLDTGDNRLLQAVSVGDGVWTSHTATCGAESCVRVVRLLVGAGSDGALTARLAGVTNLTGGAGIHYWMPAVAVNRARQIAVTFLASSATRNLGSFWTWKPAAAAQFLPVRRLAEGNCGRIASTRSGDFLGAQVDPGDLRTFWLAGERAWALPSCAWQTWIARTDPNATP